MAHSAGVAGVGNSIGRISATLRDVVSISFEDSKKIFVISLIAQTFLAALKIGLAVSFSLKNIHSIMILPFAIVALKGVAISLLINGLINILSIISFAVLEQSYKLVSKSEKNELRRNELRSMWNRHVASHYGNQQKMNTYFSLVNGVFYSIVPRLSVALLPSIIWSVVKALRAINYSPVNERQNNVRHRDEHYASLTRSREAFLKTQNWETIYGDCELARLKDAEGKIWADVEKEIEKKDVQFSNTDRVIGTTWVCAKNRVCNYLLRKPVLSEALALDDKLCYRLQRVGILEMYTKLNNYRNLEQEAWNDLGLTLRTSIIWDNETEQSQKKWSDALNQLSSFVRESNSALDRSERNSSSQ